MRGTLVAIDITVPKLKKVEPGTREVAQSVVWLLSRFVRVALRLSPIGPIMEKQILKVLTMVMLIAAVVLMAALVAAHAQSPGSVTSQFQPCYETVEIVGMAQ
jgi:hypothetical protein